MQLAIRRFVTVVATTLLCPVGLVLSLGANGLPAQGLQLQRPGLPTRLTDAEFWRFVTDASEAGGNFPSDNFTSNEMGYPRVLAMLHDAHATGGAYLGVGPEQNFSYIAGIQPQIAFIVDIRRQAVMQHLMYKAIFELAKDRADFVSLLFSKPRPAGLDSNLARIEDDLTKVHHFALDAADLASLAYVYEAFYRLGPVISYGGYGPNGTGSSTFTVSSWQPLTSNAGGTRVVLGGTISGLIQGTIGGLTVTRTATSLPNQTNVAYYGGVDFAALTAAVDADGNATGFLGSESAYRFLKDLQSKNLLIPVVGDFAGPKAIRDVGQYVRSHGATITAFYTSNVEQYLFQNGVAAAFYQNVGSLPTTPASVFIRGGASLCPIDAFVAAFTAGRITRYQDAVACVQ